MTKEQHAQSYRLTSGMAAVLDDEKKEVNIMLTALKTVAAVFLVMATQDGHDEENVNGLKEPMKVSLSIARKADRELRKELGEDDAVWESHSLDEQGRKESKRIANRLLGVYTDEGKVDILAGVNAVKDTVCLLIATYHPFAEYDDENIEHFCEAVLYDVRMLRRDFPESRMSIEKS